ncbi:MAG TPA: hypothetical protein DIW31_01675 [Bacteroidales bacterium]|nr:hypothetical protein [Bacteroidales bacterium]
MRIQITILAAVFFMACSNLSTKKPVDYVDPMIGTGGTGHTFPGSLLPFGMVQLSPDTRIDDWQHCSGYHNMDSSIMGFSHTHLSGTGCSDLGDICIMPTTGVVKTEPGDIDKPGTGYRSQFSHKNEKAEAGYYQVFLDDYNINVELTASKRVGFHRYTFPKTDSANIILNLQHGMDTPTELEVEIVNNTEVVGMRRSRGWADDHWVYFVMQFSKPFSSSGIVNNQVVKLGEKKDSGQDLKAFFNFATDKNEQILVKVAISAVSVESARKNLDAEISDWNFDNIKMKAKDAWNEVLSKITVEGTEDQKTIFYTAMYHAMTQPSLYSDVDGSYRGRDKNIHVADNFNLYTTLSLWDTYRAENPLFTILDEKMVTDLIKTFLAEYQQGGRLPVWSLASCETDCMIGYHSIPIIVDAYIKGIKDFDTTLALQAMQHSAELDHFGLKAYKKYGYIPYDMANEGVSRTLEYAYDDWCIAQMALRMGAKDVYNTYIQRAQYYKNVFDPSTGFMRGKSKGIWYAPFNSKDVNSNYTEANAWQYTFCAPQDIDGLATLFGGKQKFIEKLDQLFIEGSDLAGSEKPDITGLIGQYVQGNEPSHHMAYLYNFVGEPWKTQARVRQLTETMYTSKIDGLSGNDDCGQMSAWYIFSAMGFYPVTPGSPMYTIGSPIFEKVTVKMANGKQMVIKAKNVSKENLYIQSAELNGKNYTKSYITHADLLNGGELIFEMGSQPNKEWGSKNEDLPMSTITDNLIVSNPYFTCANPFFVDTTSVSIGCFPSDVKIYYTIDGSEPTEKSIEYTKPVVVNSTTTFKAIGIKGSTKSIVEPFMARKAKFYSSVNLPNAKQGIKYSYYEGSFRKMPNIDKLTILKKGVIPNFDILSMRKVDDNYLLKFTGFIDVPQDGIYDFYTISDDASMLYIENELVVNNDGLHGPTERAGKIALKAGKHPFVVTYLESGVDETLNVLYEGPGINKQPIPATSLYY